ncbi:glucokinase [Cribrihabitans neustonicus]|uniref:glucokinase n=1 Tax=Cribrihabitans neustonicus TaxID=1429085 RepID=UPI003B58EE83
MASPASEKAPLRLVADAGGSNTRLALGRAGQLLDGSAQSFPNADWPALEALMERYLADQGSPNLEEMVVAVAGPVDGNTARLTNRNWQVETSALAARFGCARVHLLNDLSALGYAVPSLAPSQLSEIRPGSGATQPQLAQSLVAGIGTGFNVSPVLATNGRVTCPAAEAGHAGLPLSIAEALRADGLDPTEFPTVETLFSGRGFTAYCRQRTGDAALEGSAAIAAYGAEGREGVSAAVERYSTLIGLLLRDLSLYYMCGAGIYMAGSVARAVLSTAPGPCVTVLETPARIGKTAETPVWTIEDDRAALLGCAGFAFG